jgi:mono/diheme cytochrome c family protein
MSSHRSSPTPRTATIRRLPIVAAFAACLSCTSTPQPPPDRAALAALGEEIFFTETFDGNGRTCGTCHRREDNFGLSPAFIATLPDDDPLFVAERDRALRESFEVPERMRRFGVILENQDGFSDLENDFNLRGVPHLLALSLSVDSAAGAAVGWSGDGAPGDLSLRAFPTGAVIQHFTRTMNRVAGRDFRLPTDLELDALEAFVLTLGRQEELALPLPLRDAQARRGQTVFLDDRGGKCNVCHVNAGANANEAFFGPGAGNLNFNTGLPGRPGDPQDDGFSIPGNGEFNTPTLVEAADTAPFFHNNTVDALEAAVAFYNSDAFNRSPSGQTLRTLTGGAIAMPAADVQAVAAFLRVLNTLENIRASLAYLDEARGLLDTGSDLWRVRLDQARHDTEDAAQVLRAGRLHAPAVASLEQALELLDQARERRGRSRRDREAIVQAAAAAGAQLDGARSELIEPGCTS